MGKKNKKTHGEGEERVGGRKGGRDGGRHTFKRLNKSRFLPTNIGPRPTVEINVIIIPGPWKEGERKGGHEEGEEGR